MSARSGVENLRITVPMYYQLASESKYTVISCKEEKDRYHIYKELESEYTHATAANNSK